MKTKTLAKKTAACFIAACMVAQPALGALTDISTVPLGTAAGAGYLPNLLFTLDNSGSMDWDFLPDYVNPSTSNVTSFPCMNDSTGSTDCQLGDPPYAAGGQFAMNGVGYDPNFNYLPGLDSNGQPHLTPPLDPTKVPNDAYLTGTGTTDVTSNVQDRRFCNNANPPAPGSAPCKRNGANDATGLVLASGGTDVSTPTAHTLAAGQFPYRTHSSNSSTLIFGLPEMMSIGTFIRNTAGTFVGAPTSTVRVTTTEQHGIVTGDLVFTNVTNMAVTCVAVTKLDNNNFTYNTGANTAQNRTGFFRKCVNLGNNTFVRAAGSTTVTVTSNNHGMAVNDVITTANLSVANMNATSVTATSGRVTAVTANSFDYTSTASTAQSLSGSWVRTGLYNIAKNVNGPAVAYTITPVEYCTDINLTNCTEYIPPAVPPAGTFPAYVRFCKTQADAFAPGAVTGTSGTPATARCQAKFVDITGIQYRFPRYGWFKRDTIASGVTTYGSRPSRSDCATPPTCSYNEEIQNYSRWFTYYRKRMQMMKTSAGRAFLPFVSNPSSTPPKPDRLRVGFITIHVADSGGVVENPPAGSGDFRQYLRLDTFNTTQATKWYKKFYEQDSNNATPLREALSRAGWIFAGKLDQGLTKGIPASHDPVQASCQRNYTFLTTDGFWNGNAGQTLAGGAIGNRDNVNNQLIPPYVSPNFMVSRASGTFDGNLLPGTTAGGSPGGSGTLADVAMYYYETDLRPAGSTSPSTTPAGGDVSTDNVQAKSGSVDFAIHQHMNTYTIGLADGLMRYTPDYDDPLKPSDFNSIKNGLPAAGNCFWTTGSTTCNWPTPQENNQSALDDLWHAAVNGRGKFYSALNPTALSTGLSSALNNLNVSTASAAAAATSSPQVSQQGTKAFSTLYQTSTWSGEVYAQNIDPQTGVVLTANLPNDGKVWEAQKLLVTKANAGTRKLLTYDIGQKAVPPSVPAIAPVATKLKDFRWTAAGNGALYNSEKSAYFLNKCSPLGTMSQCSTLTPLQLLTANDGSSLVDYLSGKATFEGSVFRDRAEIDATGAPVQTVLGDIVNSQPLFIRPPFFDYSGTRPNGHGEASPPDGAGMEGPELYKDFQKNNATRPGALLVGANDGFLHAFDPTDGQEMWAYTPRFLMPNLYQLADTGYPGQHRFYVDGTPELADVFDKAAGKWRTIVVGGTNAGGRGFYALDVTDPKNPRALWEFCANPTLCPDDYGSNLDRSDQDLGYSYGNPVIGRRIIDGRWIVVVTSGLNNAGAAASDGNGKGYFYVLDALSGEILHKILADEGNSVGSTTTPSGLMKIGAYYPSGLDDPLFLYVYGGDQQGNVWRVDLSDPTKPMAAYPAVTSGATWVRRLATLKDADGRIQPITARPAGTHLGNLPYDKDATRIYYVGTGRYVGNSDLSDPSAASGLAWQQTIYGIRDQIDNPRAGWNPAAKSFREGGSFVVQQDLALSGGGPDRTISKKDVDWKTQDGFFVDLNPKLIDKTAGDSPGERVVLDVRLVLGTLIFTSTIPKSGCEPGGDSFQYFLDFKTGGYVGNDATAISGVHIGSFLVGTAVEQTADDLVKTLNKTVSGDNRTAAIPTDPKFLGQRFSFRER